MSDETPADQTPDVPPPAPDPSHAAPSTDAPVPQSAHAGDSVTDGGYAYTVVDETNGAKKEPKPKVKRESKPLSIAAPLLAALIIVPAILVGVGAWFLADMLGDDGGGGGNGRAGANVASVINVFGAAQGSQVLRLEGELPPGLPDDIPTYPGAAVLSSLVQPNGDDAVFLVVYDTGASLEDVGAYFRDALGEDPWQIDLGQETAESGALQFTKIDDADIEGQVLLGASKDSDLTTIFMIVQIIGGADDIEFEEFTPPVSKTLPEGFPENLPTYPDGIVTQTVFQRAPQGDTYGLSIITRDEGGDALNFYRDAFEEDGWTVTDADGSGSGLENAQAISFESDDGTVSGTLAAGDFAQDDAYTQIELQVRQLDDTEGD